MRGDRSHDVSNPPANPHEAWLEEWVLGNGGVAGTVHLREGNALVLRAALNIPPKVQEIVRIVPHGKGMAGLAFERDDAVSTCNLKTDASGDVRPGAKAVDANAAVAIPVHDAQGQVRAVVGIAYMGEREMSGDELARLRAQAEALPA
jgi:L-methionine (R)-S-oxide reductase